MWEEIHISGGIHFARRRWDGSNDAAAADDDGQQKEPTFSLTFDTVTMGTGACHIHKI